jgi:hypothetical protein
MSEEQQVNEEQVQDEAVGIEMVFCGIRLNNAKQKGYAWANVETPDETFTFKDSLITAGIGGVYQFWRPEGKPDSIYTSGKHQPHYLRRFDDDTRIKKWALADEAAKEQLNLKSVNNKAAKVEPLEDLLDSISTLARQLTAAEKRALHAKISETLFR